MKRLYKVNFDVDEIVFVVETEGDEELSTSQLRNLAEAAFYSEMVLADYTAIDEVKTERDLPSDQDCYSVPLLEEDGESIAQILLEQDPAVAASRRIVQYLQALGWDIDEKPAKEDLVAVMEEILADQKA